MGWNGNNGISSINRQYICRAVLRGAYEADRKIPLPTSQMPLGGFKRKVLGGFWAKRLILLMTIKKSNRFGTALSSLNSLLTYILSLLSSFYGAGNWGSVSCSDMLRVPQLPSDGAGTQTQDFWLQTTAMNTLRSLEKEKDMKLENKREETLGLEWGGWVNVVPLEIDLSTFHNPETAISGKGRDPKGKWNTIQRVIQKGLFPAKRRKPCS